MAKTKLEKIESVREEIEQLKNREKQLIQDYKAEERKARNHRLCKRGGIVEKLLPDIITLTDEQFETFVGKTLLTDHTKRILAEMTAQTTTRPAHPQGGTGIAQGAATIAEVTPAGGA